MLICTKMSSLIYLLQIAFCICFLPFGFVYSCSTEYIFQSLQGQSAVDIFAKYITQNFINHSNCAVQNNCLTMEFIKSKFFFNTFLEDALCSLNPNTDDTNSKVNLILTALQVIHVFTLPAFRIFSLSSKKLSECFEMCSFTFNVIGAQWGLLIS